MSDETPTDEQAPRPPSYRERAEKIAELERARAAKEADELDDTLEHIKRRAMAAEESRKALACVNLSDADGAAYCEGGRWFATCPFSAEVRAPLPVVPGECPRARVVLLEIADRERSREMPRNLEGSGVPDEHRDLLLRAARGETKLHPTPALIAVRNWITAQPRSRILMLAGPTGVGKSLASGYAIARLGGVHCKAAQITRPGFDLEAAEVAPLLVIDQFGREHAGPSEFGRLAIEDLIDTRYGMRRPSILCGNLTRAEFDQRYEDVLADRFRGGGQWVQIDGKSLRGAP